MTVSTRSSARFDQRRSGVARSTLTMRTHSCSSDRPAEIPSGVSFTAGHPSVDEHEASQSLNESGQPRALGSEIRHFGAVTEPTFQLHVWNLRRLVGVTPL